MPESDSFGPPFLDQSAKPLPYFFRYAIYSSPADFPIRQRAFDMQSHQNIVDVSDFCFDAALQAAFF
jgi:hypothetical protein